MPVWGLLLSFSVAVCWALSPIFMKEGMRSAGAHEVNPIRSIGYLAGNVVLLQILQPGYIPPLPASYVIPLAVNVFIGNILGDVLYIMSIRMIGVSLAVSVSCAYPLVTTLTSGLVLNEEITLLIWCGTIAIVLGLLAIRLGSKRRAYGDDAEGEAKRAADARTMMRGFALAAIAAVCWGVNIPYVKRIMVGAGWNPQEYYFWRAAFFFAMVWGVWFLQRRFRPQALVPLRAIPARAWLSLMVAGALSLSLGGWLFAVCIQSMPVATVTPITASSPLVAVVIARFTHKERLTRLQMIGVALIVAGSIIVSI